jgi:DNA replication protein DnaC
MRECDDCGQTSLYEPLICGRFDLFSNLPHLCDKCAQARREKEDRIALERHKKRRRAIWEDTIPIKYRETETKHPDFNIELWRMCRHLSVEKSMALIGPAGRCKTRVFALLAARAIDLEHSIGWCPANSFQWAAQAKFDDQDGKTAREWLKAWKKAGILFLDDLGKHKWSETVETEFFNLLEHRSSHNLPTHWSMNPDPSDTVDRHSLEEDPTSILARALDPSGIASKRPRFAPIVSRLLDNTTLIPVP